ncbi:MAG: hypothetical protein EXR51_08665 [Dehalococcoidia bacterium]|nr:hypothetical protein [Dehalococcoidia bacterium]
MIARLEGLRGAVRAARTRDEWAASIRPLGPLAIESRAEKTIMEGLSTASLSESLRRMLLIRRVEEQVIHFASDYSDLLTGNYHVYIGQEATGVAVCRALAPGDLMFTTHRNHGHLIARGAEPGRVLAEIIGRVDGCNRGRGGIFHVAAPELGVLHTSAIVGGAVPLAAGAALALKRRGGSAVSAVFFGDGSLEEGATYEGLALASLWQLPVLFVCEHNGAAPESRSGGEAATGSHPSRTLSDFPSSLGITSNVVDGVNFRAVYAAAAVASVRIGGGPVFLEARTTGWPVNRGGAAVLPGGDFNLGWAWNPSDAPPELQAWTVESDPVARLANEMVSSAAFSRAELDALDREVSEHSTAAARFALASPWPAPERALQHVFP